MNIIDTDLQWMAGIVDSEGSIELRYANAKRRGYQVKVRVARMRIKTCDEHIVPKVASLVGGTYQRTPLVATISIVGGRLRSLLPRLIPYLYTKQPHARLVLDALNIKSGLATAYSEHESSEWHRLHGAIKTLNLDSTHAKADTYERQHTFSWPWLAGLVDGDGTIITTRSGQSHHARKPILKISLVHESTIRHLADQLRCSVLLSGGGGAKRQMHAIRLMSSNLLNVLPEIIPFLAIKRQQAELALTIVRLRASVPNGQWKHPNVATAKALIDELDAINRRSLKSHR